jgi:hypothetical protein
VKDVFQAALERPTPVERGAFLDEACAGDAALRGRVDALLHAHDKTGVLLDRPALVLLDGAGGGGFDDDGHDDWLDFLAPPTKPGSLGRLGHYEVLEIAGRGGMGIVFRAFDEKLQRVVAIRALAPVWATSLRARQQFVREARAAAAAVTHEHVIAIYGVEEADAVPYFVMQFVDGVSLEEKIRRTGPLPLKAVLRIGLHVAEGLAAAHRQGLVHRDVKPANILLENGVERVKITDFGLARAGDDTSLTQSGLVTGTPTFMSPEQAQGEAVEFRSDLFSLGSVLYAMCTGEPPFGAESTLAVLKRVCEESPRPIREVNAEVPAWLAELIARLHAKAPAGRPASAAEVAEVLARRLAELQDGGAGSAAALSSRPLSGGGSRRRRWVAAGMALLAILAVVGLTEVTGVTRIRLALTRGAGGEEPSPGERSRANAAGGGSAGVATTRTSPVVATDLEWERSVAELPPDDQARAVAARLKERNPRFGGLFTHKSSDGRVTDFRFSSEHVSDISPVRALHCAGSRRTKSPLTDLSPLKGMHLEALLCQESQVSDLSPLRGMMSLLALDCSNTDVADLTPLKGTPLVHLVLTDTRVTDLSPIRGMPLSLLLVEGLPIEDVSVLAGMPLTYLGLYRTRVSDLSPLKGLPLEMLQIRAIPASDLSPLRGVPLKDIHLDFEPARDGAVLRSLTGLERINRMPAGNFLTEAGF